MSSVWDVYYSHWAKESNSRRYEIMTKNGIRQTNKAIWGALRGVPLDIMERLPFNKSDLEDLLQEVEFVVDDIKFDEERGQRTVEKKMYLLGVMVEYLLPDYMNHPKNTKSFNQICYGRTAVRLQKNLGKIKFPSDWYGGKTRVYRNELRQSTYHSLDAILALM